MTIIDHTGMTVVCMVTEREDSYYLHDGVFDEHEYASTEISDDEHLVDMFWDESGTPRYNDIGQDGMVEAVRNGASFILMYCQG